MKAKYERVRFEEATSVVVLDLSLPKFDAPWHFHPEVELTYIVRGEGERFVGDSIEPYTDGDFVLLGGNTPHYWNSSVSTPKTDDAAQAIVLQFRETLADSFPELNSVANLLRSGCRGGLQLETDPDLVETMLMFPKLRPDQCLTRLLQLLTVLVDLSPKRLSTLEQASESSPAVDQKANQRISKAIEYVHRNLARPDLSLPEIAEASQMSPAAFSRYFHRQTGTRLNAFIASRRIAQAVRMLRQSDDTIDEIATASGFGSLSSFNRQFRRFHNQSPHHFRRKADQKPK